MISIHALFAEGDSAILVCTGLVFHFYPRPLRRGRPRTCISIGNTINFYPRPLRRGRLYISLHLAPLTPISIHALFAEGDMTRRVDRVDVALFLSTPSSQRATLLTRGRGILQGISIHALFAEGDSCTRRTGLPPSHFYPRPLRRGRPPTRRFSLNRLEFLYTPS